MQPGNGDERNIDSRREFFAKVAATAPLLFTASQPQSAAAVSNEPTKIELVVDTEYLIRVLNYFDGDMRKVLGVLVRAPTTKVEIDPPETGLDPKISPQDAILRALYSYGSPKDYELQSSWLKVEEPGNKGILRPLAKFLTKKRYTVYLPAVDSTGEGKKKIVGANGLEIDYDSGLEVVIKPTGKLNNLEAAAGLAVVTYPLAYGLYNYESYQEEQAAKLKRKKMAAKKAAKAKAAAAKKAAKGTSKKGGEAKGAAKKKKASKKAMKGQEMKKDGSNAKKSISKKKATTAKDADIKSIEDQVAADMLDSQRKNVVAATEKLETEDKVAAEMLDSQRKNVVAATEKQETEDKVAAEMLDSKRENFIESNMDTFTEDFSMNEVALQSFVKEAKQQKTDLDDSESRPAGANLRTLAENIEKKKGSVFNSYLDSL